MYKITFNQLELNKFNLIEKQSVRNSCMSVYMYLLKLNEKKNDQLFNAELSHLKDSTKLNISYRDFLEAYNINHNKLSIRTFKNRIDKLIELGLIIVEKFKNSFLYSFHRFTVNENVNEKVNSLEVASSIENTDFEADDEECKYLNNKTKLDIDSTSCSPNCSPVEVVDNFDYEQYVNEQEKVTSWEYVSDIIGKMFVTMKVKSNWIKGHVIDKIFNNYENITMKHCVAYVCTTIANARKQYYSNYNKYVRDDKYNNNNTYSTFNNFEGRSYSSEDINDLESQLLGWT